MSRIPMSPSDLVDLLQSGGRLTKEEDLALSGLSPTSSSGELRRALLPLIERGRLRRIEDDETPSETELRIETLRLEDPVGRARFRLRLERELPLRITVDDNVLSFAHHELEEFLTAYQSLVSLDKILSPRELIHEIERGVERRLQGSRAEFHSLTMPGNDGWPDLDWESLPLSPTEAEELATPGSPVLYWPPSPNEEGRILVGLGDAGVGWSGLIDVTLPSPVGYDEIAKSRLVVAQGESILSTLIRLQGVILYDFLTGIHNRSYFSEQLERETRLAQRRDQPMALLIIDIDDFKSFNTRYGYEGGDRVLAIVACVLKAALRGTDTLARYGGEEFAVILASPIPFEEAQRIAERLRAAVADEPLPLTELDGSSITGHVTVSIGGSFFGTHGSHPHELWTVANREVLRAKSTGKNRVCFGPDPS